MFLLKNINLSTTLDLRQALLSVIINPAVENTLSAGLEVAGIARYFLANGAK
jgi:hypothetical protein